MTRSARARTAPVKDQSTTGKPPPVDPRLGEIAWGADQYFELLDASMRPEPFRMRFRLQGSGPTRLLFIMGLGGNLETWASVIQFFTTGGRQLQYTCLCFDNLGAGLSSTPAVTKLTTTRMACHAWDLCRHVGWLEKPSDRVHVVSISMGGMIALEAASLLADRCASLALVCTHAGGPLVHPPAKGLYHMLGTMRGGKHLGSNLMKMLYSSKFCNNSSQYEAILAWHRWRLDNTPPSSPRGFLAQLLAVRRHHVSSRRLADIGRRICGRILIIGAHHDRLVGTSNAAYLHRKIGHHNSELVMFDTGHVPFTESEEEFNAVLISRIERAAEEA